MGSLMLLLLHFAVMCVSLPAPFNVSISSFNMEHTLSFVPAPGTPSSARFTVHIRRLRKNSWRPVAGCLELTAGQTCNLTKAFREQHSQYQARVQASTASQTSNWTVSGRFHPLSDTVLGPPDASVSGCGNCLLLQLRIPPTKGLQEHQQLYDFYRVLIFHVQRTRDGAQFRLRLPYKEQIVIQYLEPGVEYCVSISVTSFFSSKLVSSEPYCAFTSPPPPTSSLLVVFSLLGAFGALGLLLIGLVLYRNQLCFRLLRQHLPRTLSHLVLQGQRWRCTPELSSSEMQLHKEDSADCLESC